MTRACLIAALLFGVLSSAAAAAGLQRIDVPVNGGAATLRGAVWTPCAAAPETIVFRDVALAGVADCPIKGEGLPLIVISHGARGWFGGHHDTAAALADAGFVVAAVTHDDRIGRRWRTDRPADVKSLIDFMLGAWPGRAALDGERIGFFGYSRGGYTGLALLGARPSFRRLLWHCLFAWGDRMCAKPPEPDAAAKARAAARPETEDYVRDPRIKAAVLAAPLAIVFAPDEIATLTAPIQLWRPETDQILPYPDHAEAVFQALATKPDYHVIPKAGHFAVLAPCAPAQRERAAALCRDAPGFDRVAFHAAFNAEILAFFRDRLGADPR